jgi:MFS family permease
VDYGNFGVEFPLQLQNTNQLRHNFTVNVSDAAFFGFALGVASFVTVIPLFVATLTDSTVLIGLIVSIHMVGWQLPQLFTANRVAKLRRYKPMVIFMTLHERLPFFGLALVAALLPLIGRELALILTFVMLIWQGIGGGFTATAWQSMIAKIIPPNLRGTFYGTQSAFANLLSSGGAVLAGVLLGELESPLDFTICFVIAGFAMVISLGFLAWTRETESPLVQESTQTRRDYWKGLVRILRQDHNFRWFLAARMLSQIAGVALSFYTIYAVRNFGMNEGTAGWMTAVLLIAQTIANPVLGWLGDHSSHRLTFAFCSLLAMVSAVMAIFATHVNWFYAIFALAGAANAGLWTITMALTSEFGTDVTRPYYIGLANTLIAPVTLIAPIVGGWLADTTGFQATFFLAAAGGLATAVLLIFGLRETRGATPIESPALNVVTTPTKP